MRRGNPEMETLQSVTSHQALNMVQTLQKNLCIIKNLSVSVESGSQVELKSDQRRKEHRFFPTHQPSHYCSPFLPSTTLICCHLSCHLFNSYSVSSQFAIGADGQKVCNEGRVRGNVADLYPHPNPISFFLFYFIYLLRFFPGTCPEGTQKTI
jgi:hypothetical protein